MEKRDIFVFEAREVAGFNFILEAEVWLSI